MSYYFFLPLLRTMFLDTSLIIFFPFRILFVLKSFTFQCFLITILCAKFCLLLTWLTFWWDLSLCMLCCLLSFKPAQVVSGHSACITQVCTRLICLRLCFWLLHCQEPVSFVNSISNHNLEVTLIHNCRLCFELDH